ncbi:MAG TPA: hypothetical protein VMD98_02640 [Bryocella sp.]|nr:hypothetical protein [Bryocella sp.]
MKRLAIALVFFSMCCPSPTPAQQAKDAASAQAMSLCAVIADAAKYDGKEIVVRGLYRMVIHGSILMDRACSKIDVNLREAPGYKADKQASSVLRALTKKDQFQPVDVVFRGTFRVAHEGQCFGQGCAGYEIETTELISARPELPATGGAASQPAPDTLAHESGHVLAATKQ